MRAPRQRGVNAQDGAKIMACKKKAVDLYNEGKIRAVVDSKAFEGVESVPDAINYMLSGQALGKVVVKM